MQSTNKYKLVAKKVPSGLIIFEIILIINLKTTTIAFLPQLSLN